MEILTLDEQQQHIIRREVGRRKFVEIAKEANCSLEAVRYFARILSAERKALQEAEAANREANRAAAQREVELKNLRIQELVQQGQADEARNIWNELNADAIADEIIEEGDTLKRAAKEFMESDEAAELIDECVEEKRDHFCERQEDWWRCQAEDEVQEDSADEIWAIARKMCQEQIGEALDKAWQQFLAHSSAR